MRATERFPDMAAVQRERARLKAVRDERLDVLSGHWQRMRDPALQRSIGLGVVKDLFRSVFSFHGAKELASGINVEALGGLAAMILGGRAKTTAGKALAMGLSAAVPFIAKRMRGAGNGHVGDELNTSWERVKAYVHERREARRNRRSDDAQ